MLRPGHHLRSPPATVPTPAFVSVAALPTLSRLHPGAAPSLRGKTSRIVRASAPAAREAAEALVPALAHREVARALAEEAEARLLPSAVPANVAEFGSLDVHRGTPRSSKCLMHKHKHRNSEISATHTHTGRCESNRRRSEYYATIGIGKALAKRTSRIESDRRRSDENIICTTQ